MVQIGSKPLIDFYMQPLMHYLAMENLVEITINQAEEIGLEVASKGYQFIHDKNLNFAYWVHFCYALANSQGLRFDLETHPQVSTVLPGGHRFEAMLGNSVSHGISISIRVKREIEVSLEAFGLSSYQIEHLKAMIQKGANIIISGGTSSGKTTFLNQLIRFISNEARILCVEDAKELNIPHSNHKSYIMTRNEEKPVITYAKMIDHLVRSRPDVIITGEVSVSNAFPIIRMLNSGHAGFMCTVHANSPELALKSAIPQNILMSGIHIPNIQEVLNDLTDVVLQLHKAPDGKRVVTEILYPKLNKRERL